jgi:hypothetical protein
MQIKTWKELSWEELANPGDIFKNYDGVVSDED